MSRILTPRQPISLALGRLLPALLATGFWASVSFAVTPDSIVCQSLGVDRFSLQRLSVSAAPPAVTFVLQIDGRPLTLRLERVSIRKEGFRLLVQDAKGTLREIPAPPPETYRGTIDELAGASVGGTVHGGSLTATIALADGRVFCVQPLSELEPDAESTLHAVYRADLGVVEGACPVHEASQPIATDAGSQSQADGSLRIADIAVDADFEYVGQNGGSTTSTVNDIESLLNSVNVVYERDCDLRHRLATLIIRSANPDPYTSTDAVALYNELRNHWNSAQTGIERDLVHLMTGKELDGSTIGYSAVGAVCNRSRAYGLSQARFTTNLARRIALVAHELGHNWNAVHCDGVSPCNIMCSTLGGCDFIGLPNFEPMGANAIRAFAATRTCLAPVPVAAQPGLGPGGIQLAAPGPNPFALRTRLEFFLPQTGSVRLDIFDVAGHRIASVVQGIENAGWHSRSWNGVDERGARVGPGVFYARLETPQGTRSRTLILLR